MNSVCGTGTSTGLAGLSPRYLSEIGADGVVVSDPAVIELVQREQPQFIPYSPEHAGKYDQFICLLLFRHRQGVKRIVLSREVALMIFKRSGKIRAGRVGAQAFVHGSMCVAHSGRCLFKLCHDGREQGIRARARSHAAKYYLYEKEV